MVEGYQGEVEDKPIDFDNDIHIDLEKTTSQYRRFNGRFQDENLTINDTIPVMIPASLETTNCLLFQLVLLQSDIVARDYVVGWGVFPLLNSDFVLNEGKFKVPLMFGNVNPVFDMFKKIETSIMRDLDKWVANLYFEVEKVNLMDIKVDKRSKQLYYAPIGGSVQEMQQVNRQDREPDPDASIDQSLPAAQAAEVPFANRQSFLSGANSMMAPEAGAGDLEAGPSQAVSVLEGATKADAGEDDLSSDGEPIDTTDMSNVDDEEEELERMAEALAGDSNKKEDAINYDHYQFSVA